MEENLQAKPLEILFVEDNHGDVVLVKHLLRTSRYPTRVNVAMNGEDALAILLDNRGDFSGAPDLILLDLKLPRMDGRELLSEIQKDPALRGIPVVVLSASGEHEDIGEAYALKAKSYLLKPLDPRQFTVIEELMGEILARKRN